MLAGCGYLHLGKITWIFFLFLVPFHRCFSTFNRFVFCCIFFFFFNLSLWWYFLITIIAFLFFFHCIFVSLSRCFRLFTHDGKSLWNIFHSKHVIWWIMIYFNTAFDCVEYNYLLLWFELWIWKYYDFDFDCFVLFDCLPLPLPLSLSLSLPLSSLSFVSGRRECRSIAKPLAA